MPPDPKVVLDCNIFVQAFLNADGPAASCVRLVENDVVTLLLSSEILAEVRDVLNRPKLYRKFPAISQELVDEFLRRVLNNSNVVRDVGEYFDYERDPKDEKYINLALGGAATHLISRDNDLLDLMKETDAGKHFRERFPGLTFSILSLFLARCIRQEKSFATMSDAAQPVFEENACSISGEGYEAWHATTWMAIRGRSLVL